MLLLKYLFKKKTIAFVGPCMETFGLLFARIHVVNSTGPAPPPMGGLDGDENQNKVKNFK